MKKNNATFWFKRERKALLIVELAQEDAPVAYPREPWQTLWREQILIDEGSNNFYLTISAENADKVADLDMIFTYAAGTKFTERIEGNAFLMKLDFS